MFYSYTVEFSHTNSITYPNAKLQPTFLVDIRGSHYTRKQPHTIQAVCQAQRLRGRLNLRAQRPNVLLAHQAPRLQW